MNISSFVGVFLVFLLFFLCVSMQLLWFFGARLLKDTKCVNYEWRLKIEPKWEMRTHAAVVLSFRQPNRTLAQAWVSIIPPACHLCLLLQTCEGHTGLCHHICATKCFLGGRWGHITDDFCLVLCTLSYAVTNRRGNNSSGLGLLLFVVLIGACRLWHDPALKAKIPFS